MGYTSITDIAAANSAIADLYGQTDALMRRMGGLLGETATTAYRGDRGKIAYDHSQATGNPHGLTLAALAGAPLVSPVFTGNPYVKLDDARIAFQRPAGGASPWQGIAFMDNATTVGFIGYNIGTGFYYLGPLADKVLMHDRLAFPIGSVLTISTNSANPAALLGFGTWAQTKADNDRIFMGSQVIHDGVSGTGPVAKTGLIGAYGTLLIDGMFKDSAGNWVTAPAGYHIQWKLTAQATTGNNNPLRLYLNNIATSSAATYSSSNFRTIISTGFFRSDAAGIALQDTSPIGYSGGTGIMLFYEVTGAGSGWQFWNATVHGYYASNDVQYVWKRTA